MSLLSRLALLALAALFAGATTLYSAVWIYCVHTTRGYFGIVFDTEPDGSLRLTDVKDGSPVAAAGIRAGDLITHIDGLSLRDRPLPSVTRRPGQRVRLLVMRGEGSAPRAVEVVLATAPAGPETFTRLGRVVGEILGIYPLPFLLVGLTVLFLRLQDRNAWLLATVFASFIAGAPLLPWESQIPPRLRGFSLAYVIAFRGMSAGVFLYFFSVFPTSSPIDRRWPWLKRVWLASGLSVALPLATWALLAGRSQPLLAFESRLPDWLKTWTLLPYFLGGYALGLISLVWNALAATPAARCKSRVIVWGVLVGFGPALLLTTLGAFLDRDMDDFPFWVWAPCVLALLLIPLSFAYAVVKHRVLELPVLLRRSARYLLVQRGSILLLLTLAVATTSLFAASVGPRLSRGEQPAAPTAVALGAAFGTMLLWAGGRVHRRVRERIDRAFFRSAYDARHILQDLAERARGAESRETLAGLIVHHVRSALLPEWLAVYAVDRARALVLIESDAPSPPPSLAGTPLLAELAARGQPRVLSPAEQAGAGPLAALGAECLVPLLGRDGRLAGLIVLGPRLSDEPYSGEDKRLLASVASQAAITLESIRLAEDMAERLEAERRAAHEMELAQQVQRRFLPQEEPPLRTLAYAGRCLQARAVGGDYYDFLDLGPGRLGFVLADVSGKGFPAALVTASLQASLRSRSAQDLLDLPRQLRAVNQLLFRSSELSRYATLFFGLYDDTSRRLLYANCGHNPPVVLRAGGAVERLLPTAPVLGLLLEEWECATAKVTVCPGDLLALYTDGVTEAWSDDGEEFGEARLLELLRRQAGQAPSAALDRVIAAVSEWSGAEQEDDLTLVIARGC